MGWKGQSVNDEAGQGLGAWLKWLRNAAPTTTLREARENLAAAIGSEPAGRRRKISSREAIAPATAPKSSKITVLGGLGLVLILDRPQRLAGHPQPADAGNAGFGPQRLSVNQRGGSTSARAIGKAAPCDETGRRVHPRRERIARHAIKAGKPHWKDTSRRPDSRDSGKTPLSLFLGESVRNRSPWRGTPSKTPVISIWHHSPRSSGKKSASPAR